MNAQLKDQVDMPDYNPQPTPDAATGAFATYPKVTSSRTQPTSSAASTTEQ